jgi:hypothetical protein
MKCTLPNLYREPTIYSTGQKVKRYIRVHNMYERVL